MSLFSSWLAHTVCVDSETWREQRACRDTPLAKFFPPGDVHQPPDDIAALCAGCPVRRQCFELGLELYEAYDSAARGIWGGVLIPDQLRNLRAAARLARTEAS